MRRAIFLVCILSLLVVPAASASLRHAEPPGATPLLPDLKTINQGNSSFSYSYNSLKKKSSIDFDSTTANLGRGPFEIQINALEKVDCDGNGQSKDYNVFQNIYYDLDGNRLFNRLADRYFDWQTSGCVYVHPEHKHWHFSDLNFSWLENSSGQTVSTVQKNSWCLMDVETISGGYSGTSPGVPTNGYYGGNADNVFEGCSGPRVLQGLSPGWADVYSMGTPGQRLDITKLSSGRYCFYTEVDPRGVIEESNEANNVTGTPIRINKKSKRVKVVSGKC